MAIEAFSREVLADGPIGYWRLGEPVGSMTAFDASGYANHGACSGPVSFGHPGFHDGDTAALFSSATLPVPSPRIVVRNSDSLNPAHITLEAKVRWDGPNGLHQRIMEKSSYAELAQYSLGVKDDGRATAEIRTSSATTTVEVNSVDPIRQGEESHLAATYDGDAIRLYINGVPDAEVAAPGAVSPKPPDGANSIESGLGIGNQTERDRPFNGLIDEAAVYPSALSAARVLAHYRAQFPEQVSYQYAAKVVCGKSDGTVVALGSYFTAVNVHNPLYEPVAFAVKVAIGLPGLRPGPVSRFHPVRLDADEALEIDNNDIRRLAHTREEFIKGFVVVESPTELDVVAVYTASGNEADVETLHTERVPARRRVIGHSRACVDFEAPLSVGTQFGAPAGQGSGTVVMTANGIAVAVAGFEISGGPQFNSASVEVAPAALGSPQALHVISIALDFDFLALPFVVREVRLDFLSTAGVENLAVNGNSPFVGSLTAAPSSLSGVAVSVASSPVVGGRVGTLLLQGVISSVRVGGQELWIDNVCASG